MTTPRLLALVLIAILSCAVWAADPPTPAALAASAASRPAANTTAEFLGPESQWSGSRIVLSLTNLMAAKVVWVDAAGACSVRNLTGTPAQRQENRFTFKMTPEETAALLRLCIDGDLLTVPAINRSPAPGETRPTITLRNPQGQERAVAKWSNDKSAAFENVYRALLALDKKTQGLKPDYAGPYQPDWQPSDPKAAATQPVTKAAP